MDVATPESPALTPPEAVRARLLEPLARLRARCRRYLLLDGLERVVLGVGLACLVQFVLDRWLRLSADQRGVINIIISLGWFALAYRYLLGPLMTPLSNAALAARVDRLHPTLAGRVATAVQFAAGNVGGADTASRPLMRAVVEETFAAAPDITFEDVLNHRRARRRLLEIGGWLVLVGLAIGFAPQLVRTWFERNWLLHDVPWPQETHILVRGFDAGGVRRFPLGDEVAIDGLIEGRTPDSVEVRWWTRGGRSGREPLTVVGRSRLQGSLGVLSETTHFQIHGGDERTREYTVVGIDRPRVQSAIVQVTPPGYTGLQAIEYTGQSNIELPQGSAVRVAAEFNKPITQARLVGNAGDPLTIETDGSRTVEFTIPEPRSGSYLLVGQDADGWEDRRPPRLVLNVLADAAPKVRLTISGAGDGVTPMAEIPIELQAEDDYGLEAGALWVQRRDEPPVRLPLPPWPPGQRRWQIHSSAAVTALSAQPGDVLRLWATASDNHPDAVQETSSEKLSIQVVTAMELLARITARELELRREFERLVSQQRTLRSGLDAALGPAAATQAAAARGRLGTLARQQDSQGTRCTAMGRQFDQILSTLRVNRLARSGDERRIGERILSPLDELGKRRMPAAVEAIGAARTQPSPQAVASVGRGQGEIVSQMETVLAAMSEWEGYREAVSMLEELINDQGQVRKSTGSSVEDRLDEILGGDNSTPDKPGPQPKP